MVYMEIETISNGLMVSNGPYWCFFASFFRFLELFTHAIILPLIVFQTRKNEKTKRKSEKISRVVRG